MRSLIAVVAVIGLLQQPAPLRGTWSATAPGRVLQGVWSAQIAAASRDSARGSWALLGPGSQIVAEGTWTAVRARREWSGTWSARVAAPGRAASAGRALSGTWRANPQPSASATLGDALEAAVDQAISGVWGSGAARGTWSVRRTR